MPTEKTETKTKAIPELSVDTKLLYQRIVTMTPGEVVPYAELSDIIHRDCQADGRHFLTSARKRAIAMDGILTECVTNTGIKRLDDTEIVGTSDHTFKRIRRCSKQGIVRMDCVKDFQALTMADQIRHNATVAVLGALRHMTTQAKVRELESKIADPMKNMPTADTIKMLS